MKQSVKFFAYTADPEPLFGVIHGNEVILKPTYNYVVGFNSENPYVGDMSNIGIVCKGDKWGVINSSLEEVIPCVYDDIDLFSVSDNALYITLSDLKGLCSLSGMEILPVEYNYLNKINNLVQVCKSGKWSILDISSGKPVEITTDKLKAHPDYSLFLEKSKCTTSSELTIDQRVCNIGEIIESDYYDRIHVIQSGEKYGCIDNDANIILPIEYDFIEMTIIPELLIVGLSDKFAYYNYYCPIK